MSVADKERMYEEVCGRIEVLLEGEVDAVAMMATVACELHHGIGFFHWTGFYRVVEPGVMKVGPYQGRHGCLVIPFDRGICGRCARSGVTVNIVDVHAEEDHIACSGTTRSEIVVPVFDAEGELRAVLDVDSDLVGAFDGVDEEFLERVCGLFRGEGVRW